MKKIILTFIIISSVSIYSQNNYSFKNGGKIQENSVTISPAQVREILYNNQTALDIYNEGRNKKTIGNVLLYGGFATLFGKFFVDSINQTYLGPNQDVKRTEKSRYPYIIGGAMIVVAIPIKIGFSNKIKQAVTLMNQEVKNPKTTQIESADIIANTNGIGISIKF